MHDQKNKISNYSTGKYLGENTSQRKMNGLLITKTFYKEGQTSNWHYHDNNYLTFVLKGGSQEKRENNEFECIPGMLLFYPAKEIHKNNNYARNSVNLQLEFENSWHREFEINELSFQRKSIINSPLLKNKLLNAIISEDRFDNLHYLTLETSIINVLTSFNCKENAESPGWVRKIYELLHDETNVDWTLQQLAKQLNVHPVTISKNFEKYFNQNIGDYIRMIKVHRSVAYLSKKSIGLEEIAEKCGFVDNPHFSNTFKKYLGITPSKYRSIITG